MTLRSKLTQGDKATERLGREAERKLIRAYQLSLKEIRSQIATAYAKYGGSWTDMNKYNRLANLEKTISAEIAKLTGKNAVTLKKGIADVFVESYYRTAYALESGAQAKLGFGQLNPKTIEAAIQNPLDRVGFLRRNRDNQARLTRQLQEQLTQGLIRGESFQQTARRVKDRMDVGASNALRIVQTEQHRAQTQGRLSSFDGAEEAGVEFTRIWTSTLDDRTREDHQDMDGEEANEDNLFDLDGNMVEGPGLTGEARQDINCRCTVRGEIEGFGPKVRRAREVEGKTGEIRSYTTYNKWKKGRIEN